MKLNASKATRRLEEKSADSKTALRKRASEKIKAIRRGEVTAPSRDEALALLEELHIHQVELEMQNEELRRIQADLEESRARYFDLYDLAPVGYITVSEAGIILEANLCATTLLCATHATLRRRAFVRAIAPGHEAYYLETCKKVLQTGMRQVCDLKLLRTDNVPFWARLEMSLSQHEEAAVCRIVIIDINDRKLAEQRFDAFMENNPASASISDEHGRYIYVNAALQRHVGRPTDDWVGKTFSEVWPEDVAQRLMRRQDRVLTNNQVAIETETLQAGHQERVYQVLRFPFTGPNGKKLVGSISIDVTERHRLERALREANALLAAEKKTAEEATNAKSQFLSAMSHEIRTPLNGVIGMAGLLLHTNLDAEQLSYARMVTESADTLLELVNDILDFSKIEAGRLTLEETPFDLESLIEDAQSLTSFKAQEKSLELALWYPNEMPRRFVGDAGRIKQVVMNLLSNAVKFTPDGYVFSEVEVGETVNGRSMVRISVHDTGIGIGEEKQSHLFKRFAQADESITRRFGGSGLGLSIAKQVMELMGGEVGMKSVEGAGSTFYCQLPLQLDEEEARAADANNLLAGMRVAVTGGQFVGRFVVAEWCQRWGMKTKTCDLPNLQSLLRTAEETRCPFQFVILDGGRAALTEGVLDVRTISGKNPPKLVLLSADAWEPARDLGADAVMQVPVRGRVLKEKLIELVRGSAEPSARKTQTPIASIKKAIIGRVLVADDNLINQKLACALLRKLGCDVDTADGGSEAVQKVNQNDYDLVFMDCVMPDIDGFAATLAIRNLAGECARVPIVALTASATTEDRDRCFSVGMNDFLTKPIRSEQLAECIGKWLICDGKHAVTSTY